MLIRLVIEMEEDKIFTVDTKKPSETMVDPQLVNGIFEAIREHSKTSNQDIQKIQFFNLFLYSQVYENYTLRLLVNESMEGDGLEKYFNRISEGIDKFIASYSIDESIFNREAFQAKLEKLILPLTQDPLSDIKKTLGEFLKQEITPKIALVGLTQAGKTSIKYRFFENWSEALAKKTKPTTGVDYSHHFQEFILHKLVVMDLGGQSIYRNLYLEQDDIWKEISVLLFIVDIQNDESFILARNYLTDIWRICSRVNQKPPTLAIFLHKYDPDKRKELNQNIIKCFDVFEDFIAFSNIYLTTIEDSSSNIALIKALYHSLPQIILLRLLEQGFIDYFEKEILPQFSILAKRLSNEGFSEVFSQFAPEIRQNAKKIGIAYGITFQKRWLNQLQGEWILNQNNSLAESMILNLEKNSLTISIKTWIDHAFPEELTTLLLDGILEGILQTLHLDPPKIVERNGLTKWLVMF